MVQAIAIFLRFIAQLHTPDKDLASRCKYLLDLGEEIEIEAQNEHSHKSTRLALEFSSRIVSN